MRLCAAAKTPGNECSMNHCTLNAVDLLLPLSQTNLVVIHIGPTCHVRHVSSWITAKPDNQSVNQTHCPIHIGDTSCSKLNYCRGGESENNRIRWIRREKAVANFIDNSFLCCVFRAIGECCQSCAHSCVDERTTATQRKEGSILKIGIQANYWGCQYSQRC